MATPTEPSPAILAVDPGTSSTKLGYFVAGAPVQTGRVPRLDDEVAAVAAITAWMRANALAEARVDAVVGRGGLLRPVPSGVLAATDALVADLRANAQGHHPANLGGLLARRLADAHGVPAYVVDPVSVDELDEVARVSGLAELPRRSLSHALNIKAAARLAGGGSLVVAHLGCGISVAAVRDGRIVDVNNANEEGPFGPDRCGGLPAGQLAQLIFAGRFADEAEADAWLNESGGLAAYLGTHDVGEIENRIAAGDAHAAEVLDAMAYQIGKEIGAYAAALAGRVDAVVLTGGLARHERTVAAITAMVSWIAPVRVFPGEDELAALAAGAARALTGAEPTLDYAEVHR